MGLKEKESSPKPCTPSGLALLLSAGSGSSLTPQPFTVYDETAAAAHVFQLQEALPSGDELYPVLSELLEQRTMLERGSPTDSRPGRLGPRCVEVDHISGQLESNNGTLVSIGNFSSCRANACVYAGKWQYETTIFSAGIMQIGWATLHCPFTSEEGVGDAPDSFAFDGKRVKKWHVKCTQYGEAWAAGDVIGCCLDLDCGEATFYRNGRSMGVAFTGIRTIQPHLAYFPAVSLSSCERCELNFGGQPLLYPVPGYQPMQAPPPASVTTAASYLVACVERLVISVQPCFSLEGAAGASAAGKSSAATAAAAACGRAPARPSMTIPWDSWVMLGSVAIERLSSHLLDAYVTSSVLLPSLLRLAESGTSTSTTSSSSGGPGAAGRPAGVGASGSPATAGAGGVQPPSALSGFLQLLELCMEPEMLSAVVNCLLEALSRRCVSAALVPEHFPYSGSCPYLGLAASLASRPALRVAWRRHPNLWEVLEGFLTRKSPSPDDLRHLVPHVWWRGCSELGGDRERMRGALQALSTAIARVEDKQYELMACLLGGQGSGEGREDPLVEFLRYLVHKNKGATRDIPPPGLSDSTVLISAYFVLVRMLRTALPQTNSFPAGALFVKTAMKADLEPVNSLARLGGIVTHLCRESPVTAPAELAPLPVSPPPRPAGPPPSAFLTGGGGFASSWTSSLGGAGGSGAGAASSPSSGSSPTAAVATMSTSYGFSTSSLLFPPPASEADSWVVSRVRACPRLAADLVDLAMTLYAFKVGSSVKMTHNLSNTVAASLTGMEEVERQLRARGSAAAASSETAARIGPFAGQGAAIAASYTSYLQEARDFFRQDVSNNVRFSSLLKVVFFSGWKQEACLALAGWLSRLLMAAAAQPGPLLSYVPSCYLDCILDTLTSVRLASEAASGTALSPAAQAPSVAALRLHGSLGDLLAVLVTLLHEPRICTPDAKEALVSVLGAVLDQPGMMAELEASDVARMRLVGAAVAAFDSRLWHPVSQVLLRLVRGKGFGEQLQPPPPPQGLRSSPPPPGGGTRGGYAGGVGVGRPAVLVQPGSVLFRELLIAELRPDRAALQPFLHRLFNMANWATSEFAATVADLQESRSRRHVTEQQQQFRKAGVMFELVAALLRLLEFTASSIPVAFLSAGAHATLNLNRLLEVVSFVLSHFTEGSDARRLADLLTLPPLDGSGPAPTAPAAAAVAAPPGQPQPPQPPQQQPSAMSSTVRLERTLLSEKVNKSTVLAPVVGALLGLWHGAGCGSAQGEGHPGMLAAADERAWRVMASAGDSGADGEGGGGAGAAESSGPAAVAARRNVLLDALLRHWDAHTEKQMAFLRTVDWRLSLPGADPASLDAGAREFSELLQAAAARRQQLSAEAAGPGGGSGPGEDAPEEFLDPITSALMVDPVVLPDSQVTVDRSTIERHFLNSPTDPFSRTQLTREALRPNEELRLKIQDWLKSRGRL